MSFVRKTLNCFTVLFEKLWFEAARLVGPVLALLAGEALY
jgi:hypothetical protein